MSRNIIILSMLLLLIDTAFKQHNSAVVQSKAPCKLYVRLGKLSSAKIFKGRHISFYKATARLVNTSRDTIKYMDWYCSHAVWSTNNPAVGVYEANQPGYLCDKNILEEFKIPPHSTKTMMLTLISKKGKFTSGEKFKLNVTLINPNEVANWIYDPNEFSRLIARNIDRRIWSEEVMIP